jgi:hypothetical protein
MSKADIKKKKAGLLVENVDPVVTKVQETLEENLTFFIDNIAGLVKRYDVLLGRALQLNKGTAAEIAALQAAADSSAGADDAGSAGAGGAAAAAAAAAAGGDKKKKIDGDDDDDAATTKAVAPIVRQASQGGTMGARMPSSPLLKRAASPTQSGDQFPTIAPAAAGGAAAGAGKDGAVQSPKSTTSSSKNKSGGKAAKASSQQKVRVIEIKFPDNTEIVRQLRLLKREAYELSSTMDGIHDWIALSIPEIQTSESGENDGVEVMGAVIEQVSSLTDTVKACYSAESKYLEDRADLEKAMLKLPESETMRLSLAALDCDTWDEIDRAWRTLVRVTLLLYSILSKNMSHLKEPRKEKRAMGMFM